MRTALAGLLLFSLALAGCSGKLPGQQQTYAEALAIWEAECRELNRLSDQMTKAEHDHLATCLASEERLTAAMQDIKVGTTQEHVRAMAAEEKRIRAESEKQRDAILTQLTPLRDAQLVRTAKATADKEAAAKREGR